MVTSGGYLVKCTDALTACPRLSVTKPEWKLNQDLAKLLIFAKCDVEARGTHADFDPRASFTYAAARHHEKSTSDEPDTKLI